MMTKSYFEKVEKARDYAVLTVAEVAPKAQVNFVGADEEKAFFKIVAKATEITEEQADYLQCKTRFGYKRVETRIFLAEVFVLL